MSVVMMPKVRVALRRLVQDPSTWPVPSQQVLRNLLLDACGGDARPLIALLVRAAEFGIPDRLQEAGSGPAAWERLRGGLTVMLVADGFLQQEWAVWAVETWAYGLGVIEQEQLQVGLEPSRPVRSAAPPPRQGAVPAKAAPRPLPAVSQPPAGPRSPRSPSAAPRSGAPLPPLVPFSLSRRGKLLLLMVPLVLAVPVFSLGRTLRERRSAPSSAAPDPVADSVAPAAPGLAHSSSASGTAPRPGIPSLTMGALPPPKSGEELRRVVPPTRAGVGVDPTKYPPAYTTYTAASLDRILLRGGRELTGRVEVVRASTVQFRDAQSGLRYEFRKPDIIEITTEFGTKVRFEPNGTPSNDRGSGMGFVPSELSGVYSVRYGAPAVQGSPECKGLWAQMTGEDRVRVEHRAGADTATMTFLGGGKFTAVVDNAGRFATSIVVVPNQAYTSSAITTRIDGRFRPTGFDAIVHILAYRRSVSGGENDVACRSDIPATGESASAESAAAGSR
jgi:hypothetical protein